ncbi:MAG: hypothetical protein REI11_21310 [Patulibacter sp.]|nr:hypothetical protein [Patulibacter sp.]
MTFLGSVLPGARAARAPLVVGGLLLLAAWIPFGDAGWFAHPTSGPVHRLSEGYVDLSAPLQAAVVGVVAYILGTVVVAAELKAAGWWLRTAWVVELRPWIEPRWTALAVTNTDLIARHDLLIEKDDRKRTLGTIFGPKDKAHRARTAVCQDEWRLIRVGLVAKSPKMFAELERLESEGDLRFAIGPPLGLVGVGAAAVTGDPRMAFLVLFLSACVAGACLAAGLRTATEAEELMVDLIRAEVVELPLLRDAAATP